MIWSSSSLMYSCLLVLHLLVTKLYLFYNSNFHVHVCVHLLFSTNDPYSWWMSNRLPICWRKSFPMYYCLVDICLIILPNLSWQMSQLRAVIELWIYVQYCSKSFPREILVFTLLCSRTWIEIDGGPHISWKQLCMELDKIILLIPVSPAIKFQVSAIK